MTLKAFLTHERAQALLQELEEFLSQHLQPVQKWRRLLGRVSSLTQTVVGPQRHIRSLQLDLSRDWDHQDRSVLVPWDDLCRGDSGW